MARPGDSVMLCRLCGGEMRCEPSMEITYYECSDCGGIWFNAGELETLFRKRLRLALPPIPGEGEAPATGGAATGHASRNECPHCGDGVHLIPKTTYAARNIQVLGCPVCFGHFLSRAQAREIVARVSSGLLTRAFRSLLGR